MNRWHELVFLLRKSWFGQLNREEQEHLQKELRNETVRKVYERIRQQSFIRGKLDEYSDYKADVAYQSFLKGLKSRKNKKLISWKIIAVAAMLVLLVGTLALMKTKQAREVLPVTGAIQNDVVLPGMKKAQLKLADGRMVNVTGDSMQIRQSDGTQIKYVQGRIAYERVKPMEVLVYNELIVPLAGECYITLDDGTRVWMNADSKLKYPVKFLGDERKVFLEGEAYFEVVKDAKPFIVSTQLGDIQVLGTSFDVKAYREEEKMYATLVTGKVCFQGQEKMEINPGEQVMATSDGKVEKRTVNIDEYIGWKNGVYIFKDQPLERIMNDLSRWYDVSVFYQNPAVRKITFTGNLKRYDRINTFMEVLQRTGDVRYKISGNTIILFK